MIIKQNKPVIIKILSLINRSSRVQKLNINGYK